MPALGYTSGTESIKRELVENAKRMAIEELFGELITSFTTVENLSLKADAIKSISAGYVRVRGVPAFSNGTNFGEVCVSIEAYTTEEDRDKLRAKKISTKSCTADRNLTTRELIDKAKSGAIISGLVDYDRRLDAIAKDELLRLVHDLDYTEAGFVPDTETYCVRFEGTVYPIEILATVDRDSVANRRDVAGGSVGGEASSSGLIKLAIDSTVNRHEVRLSEIELAGRGKSSFYVERCSFDSGDPKWSCDNIVDGDPATSWAGVTAEGGSLPYWFILKAKSGDLASIDHIRIFTGGQGDHQYRPMTFSIYKSKGTESWQRICYGRLDRSTPITWDVFGCTRTE